MHSIDSNNFKSFKTEKGWTGEKTPQGVIVFTSSEEVKQNESVKFGVKTDKVVSGINWKALDKNGKQIEIGKTIVGELPKVNSSSEFGEDYLPCSQFQLITNQPTRKLYLSVSNICYN